MAPAALLRPGTALGPGGARRPVVLPFALPVHDDVVGTLRRVDGTMATKGPTVSPRNESGDGDPRKPGHWGDVPAELRELAELAVDLAAQAAAVHVAGARGELRIETKSSATDMVSQVDRQAERLIVERLLRDRPADAILAEEGSARDGSSGVRWVIDPLDGTTNYIYGYPAYAASVAAEVDGTARVGVVHDSVTGHFVPGDRRARSLVRRSPAVRPPSARISPGRWWRPGSPTTPSERQAEGRTLATVLGSVRDLRRSGSAALDLCHLAAGRIDAYYEADLSPWDHAAGALIAAEAGAEVRHFLSAEGRRPVIVACHPVLMPAFLDLLVEAGVVPRP